MTGCRDLFFYGLLMDGDVLQRVTGEAVPSASLAPACLEGYRRVIVAGATFPMLVPKMGATVDGVLASGLKDSAVRRLSQFEGEENYRLLEMEVVVEGRGPRRAWVYMASDGITPSTEDWNPDVWRRKHKKNYVG